MRSIRPLNIDKVPTIRPSSNIAGADLANFGSGTSGITVYVSPLDYWLKSWPPGLMRCFVPQSLNC